MFKRDKIFYSATGIFILGMLLMALGYEMATFCVVVAYLLRPTLHAFGLADSLADERQIQIHSKSGNIAFITVMLAVTGFALARVARGEYADELYTILFIGIAARATVGLVMKGDLKIAGMIIMITTALGVGIFGVLSAGLTRPSLFILVATGVVIAMAFVAKKYPKIIALVLCGIAIFLFIFFDGYKLELVRLGSQSIVLAILVGAACLYLGSRADEEVSGQIPRKLRAFALGGLALLVILLFFKIGGSANFHTGKGVGEPKEIQGVSCRGLISYHPNGKLRSCTLNCLDTLSGQELAEGTYVSLTKEGVFKQCFLQENTVIQGHYCLGGGHNFSTCFHPNGVLRLAWLVENEVIDGIPCKAFSFFGNRSGTYFHDNGRLASCSISEDINIEGISFKEGDIVRLTPEGKLKKSNDNNE